MPAEAEHAEAGHLDLDDQESDAEHDQQQARDVHRHDLEGEEGKQQAQSADHAGQHGARIPQLHGEAERAEHQQQRRHLRVRDGAQHALAPGHLHLDDPGIGGPHGHHATVEACDGGAIQPLDQRTDVGRDEVDEGRRRGQRLAIGERAAVEDRLGRQRDVAPAAFGERPGPRGQVRGHLLRHGLVRLGVRHAAARRHGMGGAHVRAWAITATSAASTRMKPADAARAPDGPTRTAMGVRATSMRLTMVCVDSTSPPGVRSVKTSSEAWSASARSMADTMNSADTGWMMPSTSAA